MYIYPVKSLLWLGSSLDDVRRFPKAARRVVGCELWRLQLGSDPKDWKSMTTVGRGVREIRIHAGGEYRVVYLGIFQIAVYVLHAFVKKTRKTGRRDVELARKRFRQLGVKNLWRK